MIARTQPSGVACAKGSSPAWSHFAPKPLKLLDYTIPWVTVVQPSGTISHLFCEADSQTCVPRELFTKAEASLAGDSGDEHVWEYSRNLDTFVLRSCPPGFQLVNSSNGVFNPALQRCIPCGPTFYIIDSAFSCQKCPKGTVISVIMPCAGLGLLLSTSSALSFVFSLFCVCRDSNHLLPSNMGLANVFTCKHSGRCILSRRGAVHSE